jgi:hypothetical protein
MLGYNQHADKDGAKKVCRLFASNTRAKSQKQKWLAGSSEPLLMWRTYMLVHCKAQFI